MPVADLIDDETLRIYFALRDEKGRSLPSFIEVVPDQPQIIKYIHDAPILTLGELGTFDDSGIMPSCIVNDSGRKLLYYVGWNPQVTVSYRLSIGMAESFDGGKTFNRVFKGPVMDRTSDEPFFSSSPSIIKEDDKWRMWYVSCTGWSVINNHSEPSYNIRYAESSDGVNWSRADTTCIGYDEFTQSIARPCVYKEDGVYKMIYPHRSITDYRTNPQKSYRLGYAESSDGLNWTRKDKDVGISLSENGWDSIMQEYPTTYTFKGSRYLIYNGNGFGQTGFGYAVLK